MKNATVDINQVARWYPDGLNYQWKLLQKMYAKDVYVGAYTMEVSIFSYRKRPAKPKN